MGRLSDPYREVICKLLDITRTTYFTYKKQNPLIMQFFQVFSPETLESFVKDPNHQQLKTLKKEFKSYEMDRGFYRIKEFLRTLHPQDLQLFSAALKNSKTKRALLSEVKAKAPSIHVQLMALDEFYYDEGVKHDRFIDLRQMMSYKSIVLEYIESLDLYASHADQLARKTRGDIALYVQSMLFNLDIDKFHSEDDIVRFLHTFIEFQNYANRMEIWEGHYMAQYEELTEIIKERVSTLLAHKHIGWNV